MTACSVSKSAAAFGAAAPVLQLAQELFLRGVRTVPERGEIVAHRDSGGERARILQRLGKPCALGAGERLAPQQGALQRAQHLGIARRPMLEPLDFLGIGAPHRLGVAREDIVAVGDHGMQRV